MSDSTKTHGPMGDGRAACGRRTTLIDDTWTHVSCKDCLAAARADRHAAALAFAAR